MSKAARVGRTLLSAALDLGVDFDSSQEPQYLAGRRLFRGRSGVLVGGFVLASNGKQIFLQKIENIRGYFRTPLVDFFFFPMPIETKGSVGQVLGKRLPVISLAQQHLAELPSGMQFIDPPRRTAAAIGKRQQHLAFFAVIRTVEPRLRRIGLRASAFSTGNGHDFLLRL